MYYVASVSDLGYQIGVNSSVLFLVDGRVSDLNLNLILVIILVVYF